MQNPNPDHQIDEQETPGTILLRNAARAWTHVFESVLGGPTYSQDREGEPMKHSAEGRREAAKAVSDFITACNIQIGAVDLGEEEPS